MGRAILMTRQLLHFLRQSAATPMPPTEEISDGALLVPKVQTMSFAGGSKAVQCLAFQVLAPGLETFYISLSHAPGSFTLHWPTLLTPTISRIRAAPREWEGKVGEERVTRESSLSALQPSALQVLCNKVDLTIKLGGNEDSEHI